MRPALKGSRITLASATNRKEYGLLLLLPTWARSPPRNSGVGRTITGDLDDYRVGASLGEVIVSTRFRVHAARRKRLQQLRIEMLAVAQMLLTGDDSCHPIITV